MEKQLLESKMSKTLLWLNLYLPFSKSQGAPFSLPLKAVQTYDSLEGKEDSETVGNGTARRV